MFEDKMNCRTFNESQSVRRSLDERLDDSRKWLTKNDRHAMYEHVAHMTKEQQESYRRGAEPDARTRDRDFYNTVNEMVQKSFSLGPTNADCPALDAARHMLENVKHGKPPKDIISDLYMRAQDRLEGRIVQGGLGIALTPLTAGTSLVLVTGDAV